MERPFLYRWDRYLRQVLEHPVRCHKEGAILVPLANELCPNGQTVGASEHRYRDSGDIQGRPDRARRRIPSMPAQRCFTGDRGSEQHVVWGARVGECPAARLGKIACRTIALEAACQAIL